MNCNALYECLDIIYKLLYFVCIYETQYSDEMFITFIMCLIFCMFCNKAYLKKEYLFLQLWSAKGNNKLLKSIVETLGVDGGKHEIKQSFEFAQSLKSYYMCITSELVQFKGFICICTVATV